MACVQRKLTMNKQLSLLFLLTLIGSIARSYSLIYPNDPSSFNLSCNPYGQDIKLQCTVEEPVTLKSPLSLLLLWYWSNTKSNFTNGCPLYPSYQCSQYVGDRKYSFNFQRNRKNGTTEGSNPVTHRTLVLHIRNVSVNDVGCYYCRPWINMKPLNDSSSAFCIKQQSYYKELKTCGGKEEETLMSSNEVIPSSASLEFYSSSNLPMNTPIINNEPTSPSSSNTDQSTNHWLYGFIALCIVLGFTILLLIAVTIILLWRQMMNDKRKHSHTQGCKVTRISSPIYQNSCAPIAPQGFMSQPQFIGTYSYVQPHKEYSPDESIHSDSSSIQYHDQPDGKDYEIAQPTKDITPDNDAPAVDPGSHIYHTLDKYIEELECFVDSDTSTTTGTTHDLYDRLFDDPNYFPICTSNPSSLLVPHRSTEVVYDRLPKRLSESSDYAYAYSHMTKEKKKKDETKESDSKKGEELMKIAALGTYEIDPEIISTLRAVPEDGAHVKAKARVVEPNKTKHSYQPIDQNTLTPDNSYTDLKNKIID